MEQVTDTSIQDDLVENDIEIPNQFQILDLDHKAFKPCKVFILDYIIEHKEDGFKAISEKLYPRYRENDIYYMYSHQITRERNVNYEFPRNIKWKDLPVIAEPKYNIASFNGPSSIKGGAFAISGLLPDRINLVDNPSKREAVMECMLKAEVFILYHKNPTLEVIADFGHWVNLRKKHKEHSDKKDFLMFSFNGISLIPITQEQIEHAQNYWIAHERFLYNYILNSWILFRKVFLQAMKETEQVVSNRFLKDIDISYCQFEDNYNPFTLQLLYHIADHRKKVFYEGMTRWNVDPKDSHSHTIYSRKLLELTNLIQICEPNYQWIWRGAGTYYTHYGALRRGEFVTTHGIKEIPQRGYGGHQNSLRFLKNTGLIAPTKSGYITTCVGEKFLQLIGSEANDPDVLLRWRKPDGRLGAAEDIPAMDRWLNRVFRSIKRKVAKMENPKFPDEEEFRMCYYTGSTEIWGAHMNFKPEEMADIDFPLEVVNRVIQEYHENPDADIKVHRGKGKYIKIYCGIKVNMKNIKTEEELKSLRKQANFEAKKMPKELLNWKRTAIAVQPLME